jgi:putative ABC transport system substrate-binding protein
VNRRDFIAGLSGAALVGPGAWGQQQLPVIGHLSSSLSDTSPQITAFRQGLNEAGYIEGQNVSIEYRAALGRYDRLPSLAADLVRRQVSVIFASGSGAAPAAKEATSTIPVIFVTGTDPVMSGLVPSLNRPSGNLTGVSFFTNVLEGKRLGLLHELVPQAAVVAALVNPSNLAAEAQSRELQQAARALGLQLHIVQARHEGEFETALAQVVSLKAGALVVAADAFFFSRGQELVALVARYAVPGIYEWREFTEVGGLASYGTKLNDAYRQAGIYTARILKGEKTFDLPVMQSTKFEFVINLKTAKALGLEVSPTLSARADEVIE